MPRWRRAAAALALATAAAGAAAQSSGPSSGFCDAPPAFSGAEQDRLLRVAAVVREALAASGTQAAIVARSGQDLARFGMRYSHAGISLAGSANAPWSVRQLFFACDEKRPRLFDQGIAGFVLGTENAALGYLSIVLLPPERAAALARRALDDAQALRLLAGTYSANAYPFDTRYQNCNQWVAELLASTWGELVDGEDLRARAQAWLREQGYEPARFDVGSPFIMMLGWFIPYVHSLDHPLEDRAQSVYRVSMPASIEAFVRAQVPGAERMEICHDERKVVVRRGWVPLGPGCEAGEGDRVVALD
jgi:hypothetical protein